MNNTPGFHTVRVISIFLLLLFFLPDFAIAQEKYSVFGKIKIENGSIENTRITILKNAEKMESKFVDNSGKFEYGLDFGNEYIFEFSKEGFVTKRVSISTFVPLDILSRDNQFPPFKFVVSLFPAYEGLDISVFDQPMGMVMYDKELDDFDYDRDYDAQIRDAIKKAEEAAKRRAAELEAQRLAKERAYVAAVQRGDINFNAKKYDLSKVAYNEALTIKPDEEYPKNQLQKIDDLIGQELAAAEEKARLEAEQKALDEKYTILISQADNQFTAKDYELSKTSYTDALGVKPNEAYPTNKIQEINKLLAEQLKLASQKKALDEKYASIITLADSQFSSGNYQISKTSYSDALSLKSEEVYPKSQIEKINEILAAQQADADEAARLASLKKALDEKYASIVKLADSQFSSGNYQISKISYSDALSLKPEEVYPKSQIEKINEILAAQQADADEATRLASLKKALDEKYASIVKLADLQFSSGDYQSSKTSYSDALSLKSEEAYPKSQIEKINEILAAQQADADEATRLASLKKALDEKYASVIALADSQFSSGDYQSSRTSYTDALSLKAEEAYPKSQIQKIDELLANQQVEADNAKRLMAEKRALDEKYKSIISLADSQFSSEEYESSKSNYTEALSLKPTEAYPKSQIQKIDELLANQQTEADEAVRLAAQQKALNDKYASIISLADSQFSSGDYQSSRISYTDALELKAKESYPKSQIQKIDDIFSEQKRLAEEQAKLALEKKGLDEKYNAFIALADSQFSSETYELARKNYNSALQTKGDEIYPKTQIQKIDEILKLLKEKADEETKIAEALRIREKEYNNYIAFADKYYAGKKWQSAINEYVKAQKVKPQEAYPPNQIEEIKLILAELERLEDEKSTLKYQYKTLVDEADQLFSREEYTASVGKYQGALDLKPAESYPKNQIKRIEVLLERRALADRKQKEIDQKYGEELEAGEKFLKEEQFSVARHHFKAALSIKPKEEYPKEKLAEIEKRIEGLKLSDEEVLANNPTNFETKLSIAKEREYASIIAKADDSFKASHYTIAKVMFERALDLFDREYPKKKLKEIKKLIRDGKDSNLTEEYRKLVARGDKELISKNYSVAKFYYKQAKQLQTSEKYPDAQLEKIEEFINSKKNQKLDTEYKSLIIQADKAYDKGNYSVARFYYKKAGNLKSNESYPKERLKLIQENQKKK